MPIRNIVTGKFEDSGMHEFAKAGTNKTGVSIRPKRTKEQHEADMALMAKLLLRENLTPPEIADRIAKERTYTLAQSTIREDIKTLVQRWRDAYLDDIDVLKGRELRRIDELESAYWDSYAKSLKGSAFYKEDVSETQTEDKLGMDDSQADESPKRKIFRSRKFTDERDGEVKFLNGIQWCINKRCEILGLNAPLKSELTFDWRSEAEKQGIDPGLMFNELVKKFVDNNIIDGETKELHG